MIFFNELGSFLYKRRKEIGYTQETVAEIIGVTARTLRNIKYFYTLGSDSRECFVFRCLVALKQDNTSRFNVSAVQNQLEIL